MSEKMTICFLTHGTHQKKGNTATTYDGMLTPEAREALKKIELPSFEKAFCGMMDRHIDTALTLNIPAEQNKAIGNDKFMFAALDDGDETVIELFREFLQARKEEGLQEILLVTSRMYPLIMKYIERGGREKLGPFQYYLKVIDDMPNWGDGTHIPLMKSGVVTVFEF